jgi:dihydrofolate reductase
MRRLTMFNNLTLDGFFTDRNGTIGWAHQRQPDEESNAFVTENASSGGALVLGRITYEQMVSFWPTPQAHQMMPAVARGMNQAPKIVFSRTLDEVTWNNTTLIKDDPAGAMRKLKREAGPDLAILGSGTIVSQLTAARLIDEFKVLINPFILGKGRTLFEGLQDQLELRLVGSRTFKNGNVFLRYEPA